MSLPLVLVAVVPAIYLIIQVYRMDKVEREPVGLIAKLIGYGILSALVAIVLETLGEGVLNVFLDNYHPLYAIIYYFLVIGGSEELAKFWLLKKGSYKHSAFNCLFDGIVYAVTVSLGFALFENLLYVWIYGFSTGVVRAFTAIPGHASFGVFMGIWYGYAKQMAVYANRKMEKRFLRLCVLLPLLIHGAYDYVLSMNTSYVLFIFIVFIVVLFVTTLHLVKKSAQEDVYLDEL